MSLYYAGNQKDGQLLDCADTLIDDVHNTLGRYRNSDVRLGKATDQHPLLGGLRIGKEDVGDDGQYFHYLTKWMFALNRMSIARRDERYNRWAVELAETVHPRFLSSTPHDGQCLWWKLDVDLTAPLVGSQGNLDPFDGLVTYKILLARSTNKMVLQQPIHDLEKIVERKYATFSSADELDLGEALWLTTWAPNEPWSGKIANRCVAAIENLFRQGRFERGPRGRLLFREMGLIIGIQCAIDVANRPEWDQRVRRLHRFWEDKILERDADISPIMYANSLLPGVLKSSGAAD